MTLIIQKPTGAKLVFAKDQVRTVVSDVDATLYIQTVEAADGQRLESGVATAINSFVLGCKADGIWNAIKASCILAGARTLAGALVPLVGTAPARQGTEGGWNYNRETGLQGNGTNNYINTNSTTSIFTSQTSRHQFVYGSSFATTGSEAAAGLYSTATITTLEILNVVDPGPVRRYRSGTGTIGEFPSISSGFTTSGSIAGSRTSSTSAVLYQNGASANANTTSVTPTSSTLQFFVFAANVNNAAAGLCNARLQFWSIGDGLSGAQTLALHNRVFDLTTAIGVAIP
jgi:hypothetical protein